MHYFHVHIFLDNTNTFEVTGSQSLPNYIGLKRENP